MGKGFVSEGGLERGRHLHRGNGRPSDPQRFAEEVIPALRSAAADERARPYPLRDELTAHCPRCRRSSRSDKASRVPGAAFTLVPGWVVAKDFLDGAGPEVSVEYLDAVPADQAGRAAPQAWLSSRKLVAERRDVVG